MLRRYVILMLIVCCRVGLSAQHIQIGDVFTFPDNSQGVVFYISPDGTRGWAVALHDASDCPWGSNNTDVPGIANLVQTHDVLSDTAGYGHTQALLNVQGAGNSYASGSVDFDNGWYLPTAMQLRVLHGSWPLIRSSLIEVGDDMSNGQYWSCSEKSKTEAYTVHFFSGNLTASGYFTSNTKNTAHKVRAVRNFASPVYHWSDGSSASSITVNPTQTTTYQVTVSNALGCDTSVVYTIVVPLHDTAHYYVTACDYYVWNGDTLTQSDVYVNVLPDTWGCDSVEVLNLVLNTTPQVNISVDTVIMDEGDTVTLQVSGADHYQWYPESGLSDPFSDSPLAYPEQSRYYYVVGYGQDSEDNNLVVNGDFELSDTGFTTAYNYVPTPLNHLGFGNYTIQSDAYDVWPQGHQYGYGGDGLFMIVDGNPNPNVVLWSQTVEVQSNTIYDFSAWIVSLCASNLSVARLQFVVNGEQLGPIFNAPSELYEWQRFHDYWNSGDTTLATITILNQNTDSQGNDFGIDHIVFLPMEGCQKEDSVLVLLRYHVDSVVCSNDLPVSWNGQLLYEADTYQVVLTTSDTHFDSIVVMHLAVNDISDSTLSLTVLENDLPVQLNDSTYVEEGIYYQNMTNAQGCDSLLTIELEVIYNVTTYLDTTICADMLPFDWDSLYHFESADTLRDTLHTTLGADSVLVMVLHVMPLPAPTHTPDTVKGTCLPITLWASNADSLTWKDAEGMPLSISTTLTVDPDTFTCYYLTAMNQYEVDSSSSIICRVMDTICVDVLPPDTSITPVQVCEFYIWYGDTLTLSGDYPHTIADALGCDSVVILRLTVNTQSTGDTMAYECNQFDWYEHIGLTTDGDYTHTFTNAVGCDSVVTLHLTILHSTLGDTVAEACNQFDWYEHTDITASGNYTHTLTNAAGCDSVVTLHLTIHHATTGDTTAVACDQFDWYEHTGITASGNYTHTLTNMEGCDSVVTLHLTIYQSTIGDTVAMICGQFDWYEYIGINEEGEYIHTFVNAAGCDSVVTLHTYMLPTTYNTVHDTVPENALPVTFNGLVFSEAVADTTIVLTNSFGCDSVITYSLVICNNTEMSMDTVVCENDLPLFWNGIPLVEEGLYQSELLTSCGADSIVYLQLSIIDTALQVVSYTEDFCQEMSAELSVITGLTDYLWSTGETTPQITVTLPGSYFVTASQGDCHSSGHIMLESCNPQIFLPSAISPSRSDGLNDVFSISDFQQAYINDFEIRIFNRWGEQFFYSTDKNFKWNGEFKGKITYNAVYVYIIRYTDANGKPYVMKGSVTVL